MVHKIDLDTPIADIIEYVKDNEAITKAFLKANLVVNQYQHPYQLVVVRIVILC